MITRPASLHLARALMSALLLSSCAVPARVVPTPLGAGAVYEAVAGGSAVVGADTVQLLVGGAPAFAEIRSLLAGARATVHVEMYEFGRDDLAAMLVAAHRRGVTVEVITDPSVNVTVATARRLRDAGISVIDYPVRPRMIDHVKLLVVDGIVGVVGGINWGSTSERNHDFDARVTGPAALNLDAVFARDMATSGRAVPIPELISDPWVTVASTLPSMEIRPLALDLIERARSSLDIELFVITDQGIVHAIARARARGVRIRMLVDPAQRSSDASVVALHATGVPLRLYRSHGEKLHAKVAVVDGQSVLLGSANWTAGGFAHNHELDIALRNAPSIAADMTRAIDADWRAAGNGSAAASGSGAVDAEAA